MIRQLFIIQCQHLHISKLKSLGMCPLHNANLSCIPSSLKSMRFDKGDVDCSSLFDIVQGKVVVMNLYTNCPSRHVLINDSFGEITQHISASRVHGFLQFQQL